MLRGSCLCGEVQYEIEGPLRDVRNCHCSMCRKAHGAAFRTRATVRAADFRYLKGEHLITAYESSPGTYRTFCGRCGSRLITSFAAHPEYMACRSVASTIILASSRQTTSMLLTRRRGSTSRITCHVIRRAHRSEPGFARPHPRPLSIAAIAPYPKDRLFVVYCAGPHCNGANKAAVRIATLGPT